MRARPTTAFVMQSDGAACRRTAAALRDLGFAVAEFADEPHLYAETIRAAAEQHRDRRSFVILAEPTGEMLRDLEVLRSGRWPTPLVLVGAGASAEDARRLRAAWLPREHPTAEELRAAIETALARSTAN